MKRIALLLATIAFIGSAGEVPAAMVHFGTDTVSGPPTNSTAALLSWQSNVSIFSSDNMNGFNGTTTTAGNSFAAGPLDSISSSIFNVGVVSGDTMRLSHGDTIGSLTWSLSTPSNAFGFNTLDHDSGTVTIDFVDGSAQQFTFQVVGSLESSFWGITGLNSNVASVTLSTTDPGGVSYWDNFVYGQTVTATPEPVSMALLGLTGLGGIGLRLRQRRKALAA